VVLIVDDDPIVREAISRGLEDATYTAVHADSALHALELMRSVQVDAVIADFDMPGMNGARFLAYVREQFPACARLILSAGRRSDIAELRQAGVEQDLVLRKGISPDELRARLASALGSAASVGE
jgi:CheY-like chemotaxis protein